MYEQIGLGLMLVTMLVLVGNVDVSEAVKKSKNKTNDKCTKTCSPVPYQFGGSVTIANDQLGGGTSFVVPEGKLLKVEDVTIQAYHTGDGDVVQCSLSTQIDAEPAVGHGLVVVPQGAAGGYGKSYTCNRVASFYASGGTTVNIGVARQLGGEGLLTVGIAGTLYDE